MPFPEMKDFPQCSFQCPFLNLNVFSKGLIDQGLIVSTARVVNLPLKPIQNICVEADGDPFFLPSTLSAIMINGWHVRVS